MPFKNIVKTLLEIKHTVIDKLSIEDNSLVIDVHPTKSFRHRCGLCGHRGTFYDYGNGKGPRLWRCTDFEGHKVFLRYSTYRTYCPHCKAVHTCKVPWAAHGSRFTHKFEEVTTWFTLQMNKSATSSYMRIAWRSVGEIASRVKDSIASTAGDPLDGLVNIGIDETSYCKGHKYMLVVVNHDNGKVVWVHEGHDKATIELFFEELGPERCKKIMLVSCDGARTIRDCIEKYCTNAKRCVDPFHVVEWTMDTLDQVRAEFWRRARAEEPKAKRGRGRPKKGGEKKASLSQTIKDSKYAVGKAPENLTENQRKKLELIEIKCPVLFRARALKESLRVDYSGVC